METLEHLIRQYVNIPSVAGGTGFYPVLCKVCNDHGKKGPRAGFRFDARGVVGYHCFNCGHKAKFDPQTAKSARAKGIGPNMMTVLRDFGVPDDEIQKFVYNLLKDFINGMQTLKAELEEEFKSIEPKELPLPKHFYALKDAAPDDAWGEIARDYLEHSRAIDPAGYPYYLCRVTGVPQIDKWVGRLIIPIYKDGKLIYYQGRALYNHTKKYESPTQPKDCVLYGFDQLFEHTDAPLYVVEGFFDAYMINGVAILGKELTDAQAEWLTRSKRQKVFIPDRRGDGSRVPAQRFIELGWSISTPDIGSCKDINDAVIKYGKLYVLNSIAEHITSDRFTALTRLGVYCEVESGSSKKKDHHPRSRKGRKL